MKLITCMLIAVALLAGCAEIRDWPDWAKDTRDRAEASGSE